MSFETPTRLDSIQALRGVAALSVVLLHIAGLQVLEGVRDNTGLQAYGWIGVDLFFIISGFIMVWVTVGIQVQKGTALRFLTMRAIRIYPLWWVCAIILAVFYGLIHGSPTPLDYVSKAEAWPFFVKSLLLIPQTLAPKPVVGWTLIHEMFFYIVFSGIIVLGLRHKLIVAIPIWGAITLLGYVLKLEQISPVLKIVFSPLTFYFMAGMIVASLTLKFKQKAQILNWLSAAIGLGVVFGLALSGYLDASQRVWQLILPISLLIFGLVNLELSHKLKVPKTLTWLGDISYSLYLTHPLVIIGWRVLKPFYPDGVFQNFIPVLPKVLLIVVDSLCVMIACLVTAFIFYHLIEQVSLKFFRKRMKNYRAIDHI